MEDVARRQLLQYRSVWIGAGAMTPRATNGPEPTSPEYATNDINLDVLGFDSVTEEGAQFTLRLPDQWNLGAIKAQFYWTAPTGASGGVDGVTWGIAARALSDSDALDGAFSASVDTDDGVITVDDLHISPVSANITVSGTPAVGDMILFEVTRVVGDTNDTMSEDALLIGVSIQFYETELAAIWT